MGSCEISQWLCLSLSSSIHCKKSNGMSERQTMYFKHLAKHQKAKLLRAILKTYPFRYWISLCFAKLTCNQFQNWPRTYISYREKKKKKKIYIYIHTHTHTLSFWSILRVGSIGIVLVLRSLSHNTLLHHYGVHVCVPPNSYAEAVTPMGWY